MLLYLLGSCAWLPERSLVFIPKICFEKGLKLRAQILDELFGVWFRVTGGLGLRVAGVVGDLHAN